MVEELSAFFSHQFILLLASAAIVNYLIPLVTSRWQDHQKQLELKTSLIAEISEEVSEIVMAVQFAEVGASSQSQADFDRAYRRWEIRKGVIASRLRAYFPDTGIAEEWDRFAEVVSEFYALTGTTDPRYRTSRLDQLKSYLGAAATAWETVREVRRPGDPRVESVDQIHAYRLAWSDMKNAIIARKDAVIRRIIDEPVRFSAGGRRAWWRRS